MTIFDSVLGRFFDAGTELELGAGVDMQRPLSAARNASTRRIDLSVDADAVVRDAYTYDGDDTDITSGAGTVDASIDEDATTITISSIVDVGYAVELRASIWLATDDGQTLYRDELRFAAYRESRSSEIHLIDVAGVVASAVGTGTQTLTLAGASSGKDYTISASYSGTLSIAVEQDPADDYVAQVKILVGSAWGAP